MIIRRYKLENYLSFTPIILFIFIAAFILIVLKALAMPQPGDENVYYYMGKLVSEGKVPYRDFFFAHPPLHIYLLALVYKIFGFKIIIMKLLPLIATLISAVFVFIIAKDKFGHYEAITSSLLFLFAYSVIFNSVFSFGIEIAAMFFIIGAYFLLDKNNRLLSGIFFGLAAVTRLLTLVPIAAIFIIVLFQDNFSKKRFFQTKILKLLSGFFLIFFLVNGIFVLLFGADYLISVYKFHLLKSSAGAENFKEYAETIKLNWILFSSFFLFFFIKEKKRIMVFFSVSVIYLMFLIALKRIFGFYFIVIFPFLAIIGGYGVVNIIRNLSSRKKIAATAAILLLFIFAWNLTSDILFAEKIGFIGFERGNDLVDYINSVSGKNTLIFGDDSTVPLLALMTNKKIAMDFVDTNNEVFISGVRNLGKILADLKGKDILFIIRSRQGISYFQEVKNFLNDNCEFLSSFHDKMQGEYLFYKCR